MRAERENDAGPGEAGSGIPFRLRRDLRVSTSSDLNSGAKLYYVKILGTGAIFEFGEEEHFLLQCLGEPNSLNSICIAFENRFGLHLSEHRLLQFLAELREMDLLVSGGSTFTEPDNRARPLRGAQWVDEVIRNENQDREAPPRHEPPPPPRKRSHGFRWHLFDPERFLLGLLWLFRPLRILTLLLVPAVLLSGVILFHRVDVFSQDFLASWGTFAIVPRLLVAVFLVHLLSTIVQGVVASGFGARMQDFGLVLAFGFLPRFYIDPAPIRDLTRRGRLWSYATPLLTRLALFSLGTIIWIAYRSTGTWWPDFALLVSQTSLFIFLITTIPLIRNDGYQWITEFIGQPMLAENGWKLLGMRLRGKPAPEPMSALHRWGLIFYVFGVVIYLGLLAVPLLLYSAVALETRFAGSGVVIFVAFFTLALVWLFVTSRGMRQVRKRSAGPSGAEADYGALVPYRPEDRSRDAYGRDVPARRASTAPAALQELPAFERRRRRSRLIPRLFWVAVLGGLVYVAFLPYNYETGGPFKILPASRVEVRARAEGEIITVGVGEGEWVEQGQVLAEMSDWNEERDLAVTKAALDKSQAMLRRLDEGPKPEEVELARKEVESARARVTFSALEAKRAGVLVKEGHMSQQKADFASTEFERNKADLAVAEANLELVKSGATESEREALRAEIRGLEQELAYRNDQLERTKIRAPAAGRVVTPNLHFFVGKYLEIGDLFTELEHDNIVQVEVEVPESDVAEVQVGDQVRLKAWGTSDVELFGNVVNIAPVAEPRNYGEIVRVKTEVPNKGGQLKSGMTGYAKIEGSQMPVWEAYSRLFVRFFRVEFWSWIP